MSAFSIHEPFPQFHDRAGQPLDGGFVWIGTAGLDAQANPIPVFFDAALTIPASQPIGTRSGFAANGATPTPVYCNANDYSIKILDANGTLVSSYANAVDRFPAAVITGALSSANVSYDRALTGTQVRTVEGRLRDFTSVFDFMTAAEIAAVQASTFLVDVTAPIAAAVASSAREIYFPPGGYLVSNGGSGLPSIYIQQSTVGKTLRGAGRQATVILNTGNGAAIASEGNPIIPNTSIHICDISVEGQPGTGDGILLTYTSQSIVERVDSYKHGAAGLRVINGAHNTFSDCWSRSNTGVAIHVGDDAYFTEVRGGTFETSASGGYVVKTAGGTAPRYTIFEGCSFRSNTSANVNVGESQDTRFFGCQSIVPNTNTLFHFAIDGGAPGVLASNVLLQGCALFGANGALTTIGVDAANCEDVAVVNSVVDCTGAVAYDVKATAVRPKFLDNAIILGTRTNASTSLLFRNNESTEALQTSSGTIFRFAFEALANAFRLTAPTVGGSPWPVLRLGDWRLWFNAGLGQLMMRGSSDPATLTDGYVVGPGVKTYTFATLPAGAPDGTMAKITDGRTFPAQTWGDVVAGGGATPRFVIHTGGGVWTIIGNA